MAKVDATFDKMIVDYELTPITIPYMALPEIVSLRWENNAYGGNESAIPNKFEFHEIPDVDNRSTYHGVL